MKRLLLRLPVVGLLCATALAQAEKDKPDTAEGDAKIAKQTKIVIGKETTYLLGPLNEQGYVDYQAALNERISKGVTPENNAAVLLAQALGPPADLDDEPEAVGVKFYKLLGIEPLPDDGHYFVDWYDFVATLDEDEVEDEMAMEALYDQAQEKPFKAMELDAVTRWLAANQEPLDLIAKGTTREQYYLPLVSNDELLIQILLPYINEYRAAARALRARAMLRLGEGDPVGAQQDLLAAHHLARFIGQGPTLVDGLVAIAMDKIAHDGHRTMVHHGGLDKEQLADFRRQFAALPPLPKMDEKVEFAERLMYLDAVQMFAEQGPEGVGLLDLPGGAALPKLAGKVIDWNETMRLGNGFNNRLVAAMRRGLYGGEGETVAELFDKLEQRQADIKGAKGAFRAVFATPKQRGEQMGIILISLFAPAVNAVMGAQVRADMVHDVTLITIALEQYQRDHKAYPKQLQDLTPDYLDAVPHDLMARDEEEPEGKPFRYKRIEGGYLLYGVGYNNEDDGGDPEEDEVVEVVR